MSYVRPPSGASRRPELIYLLLEGTSALFLQLTLTIYVVYYSVSVGLDPLQIVLVGTVFETTIFLFELPTGILADRYSRRLSIIIGIGLTGFALLIEGLIPVFGAILVAEVIAGIGATFTSGATEAWIADEVGEQRAGQLFIRAGQVKIAGGVIGTVLSVLLASLRLNLPVILSGVLLIGLAVYLIVRMPETGFQPLQTSESRPLIDLAAIRKTVQQRHPGLILILAVGFVFAFHSEGFDALWQRQFLDNFQPAVIWFGVIGVGANLFSIMVSEIVRRRVRLEVYESTARALMVLYGIMVVGILIFSLSGQFLAALLAYWGVVAVRGASVPVSKAWFNQGLESHNRATMFSLNSQVGAMGEIIGGPPVGMLGKVFSVRVALAVGGIILAFTLPLLKIALRRETVRQASVNRVEVE